MRRARGDFVSPCRWGAPAVGFGRSERRWLHLSQCWFVFDVSPIALAVYFLSARALRSVCGGFVSPRLCLVLVVALRLGFGLLRVRWFRIVFPLFGAACWSAHAKIRSFRNKLAVLK